MSDISLEKFTEEIRSKVGADSGLKATIKFVFSPTEVLYLDGESTPNTVDNVDRPAKCTVKVSLEDFAKMATKKLDPTTAFMTGKIKIEGDMGVAMRLGKLFA